MINKSLISITKEANEIENQILEADGEITEQIEKFLEVNSFELETKLTSYKIVLDRFKALEEHYKEKAKEMQKIAKSCERVQKRLKNNLKKAMEFLQTDELSGEEYRFITYDSKPTLNITDFDAVPFDYKKEVTSIEIDEDKIKADLAIGPIPGAEIVKGKTLKIYPNLNKQKKIEAKNEQ